MASIIFDFDQALGSNFLSDFGAFDHDLMAQSKGRTWNVEQSDLKQPRVLLHNVFYNLEI